MDPIAALNNYMTALHDALEAFDGLSTWLLQGGTPPIVYYRYVGHVEVRQATLERAVRPLLGHVERDLLSIRPATTGDDPEPVWLRLSPSWRDPEGLIFICSKTGYMILLSTDRKELEA